MNAGKNACATKTALLGLFPQPVKPQRSNLSIHSAWIMRTPAIRRQSYVLRHAKGTRLRFCVPAGALGNSGPNTRRTAGPAIILKAWRILAYGAIGDAGPPTTGRFDRFPQPRDVLTVCSSPVHVLVIRVAETPLRCVGSSLANLWWGDLEFLVRVPAIRIVNGAV